MANILPFKALRYDTAMVKLEQVLTQPYDKITPQMQADYYAASPHNLVRLELGKTEAQDSADLNVYSRAAEFLRAKRGEGILLQDPEPSIYAYSQYFESPAARGTKTERRGFIALCELRDYAEQVVYRHEQTLAKPKADRLDLLRATRTHSGQIFMVYSDPERQIDALIDKAHGNAPTASMHDEYGVTHSIWRISDPDTIEQVRERMREQRLIIADGHHRYETALAYRNERRARELTTLAKRGRTGQMAVNPSAPYEYVMATFINLDAPGLVILPTHRVVFGVPGFDPQRFLESTSAFFDIEGLPAGATAETALNALSAMSLVRTCFVAMLGTSGFLLKAKPNVMEKALRGYSEQQRSLDVTQLHKVLLEKVMGISEEDIRNQTYVSYLRSAEEAIQRARTGEANVALLMNPVRVDQFRDVAFAGEVMPQKSTDFYPKLMSGITLYALD